MSRIWLLALLALGGCFLNTEPETALPPAELAVTVESLAPETVTEFRVEGAEGAVVIRDRAITGVCHRTEREGAYLRDGTLTFWRAHVDAIGEVCIDLGRLVPYEARIAGLAPGSYRVRVEYIGHIGRDLTHPSEEVQVTVR